MYSIYSIYFRIWYNYIKSDTIMQEKGVVLLQKFVARKPEKEVISMRISTDTLRILDEKATAADISRNELINQMIQFALENMEESPKED